MSDGCISYNFPSSRVQRDAGASDVVACSGCNEGKPVDKTRRCHRPIAHWSVVLRDWFGAEQSGPIGRERVS
jgi:hypothetical protein